MSSSLAQAGNDIATKIDDAVANSAVAQKAQAAVNEGMTAVSGALNKVGGAVGGLFKSNKSS